MVVEVGVSFSVFVFYPSEDVLQIREGLVLAQR